MHLYFGSCSFVFSYKLLRPSVSCCRTLNRKASYSANKSYGKISQMSWFSVVTTAQRSSNFVYRISLLHHYSVQKCGTGMLSINQRCNYHSFSYINHQSHHNTVNLMNKMHALGRKELLSPLITNPHIIIPKRHLSLEWLNSLAVTQAGWFQSLSQSRLVEGLMGGLQMVHEFSNLPWWASIILSTVLLRGVLTFPLAVYQQYIVAKVENLKPEMDSLILELKRETAVAVKKFGWDEKHTRYMFSRSASKIWKDLIIRENCHPLKATLLLWFQIPLWVSMSMSFRNMASMMPHQDAAAQVLFMELSTGGIGWIPNLTDVDHSLILPVALGVISLVITEVNVLSRLQKGSRFQNVVTNMFRVLSVVMIPIAATVPSCITLYWVTSSACGLAQNLALMHPGLRQKCGIPASPSQRQHPYKHLWLQLQRKLTWSNEKET